MSKKVTEIISNLKSRLEELESDISIHKNLLEMSDVELTEYHKELKSVKAKLDNFVSINKNNVRFANMLMAINAELQSIEAVYKINSSLDSLGTLFQPQSKITEPVKYVVDKCPLNQNISFNSNVAVASNSNEAKVSITKSLPVRKPIKITKTTIQSSKRTKVNSVNRKYSYSKLANKETSEVNNEFNKYMYLITDKTDIHLTTLKKVLEFCDRRLSVLKGFKIISVDQKSYLIKCKYNANVYTMGYISKAAIHRLDSWIRSKLTDADAVLFRVK